MLLPFTSSTSPNSENEHYNTYLRNQEELIDTEIKELTRKVAIKTVTKGEVFLSTIFTILKRRVVVIE